MYNIYVHDLLKSISFMKPLLAFITLCSYLNAFVLPITSANANPLKEEIEHHTLTPKQQKVVNELKDLNRQLDFALSLPEETTKRTRIHKVPEHLETKEWESQFWRSGRILYYVAQECLKAETELKTSKQRKDESRAGLFQLLQKRERLEGKLNKRFKGQENLRKIIHTQLNKVGSSIEEEIANAGYDLHSMSKDQRFVENRTDEAFTALNQWKQLNVREENLSEVRRLLKQALSLTPTSLPPYLKSDIVKYNLNPSFEEEMKNSRSGYIRGLGHLLEAIKGPVVEKIVFALAAFGVVGRAAAAITLTNPTPPPYTFTRNQPLLLQNATQVAQAANGLVQVILNSDPSAGKILSTEITPDVTPLYWDANPPYGPSNNVLFLNGNVSQVNKHLGSLRFYPTTGFCGPTEIGGTARDMASYVEFLYQLNCNDMSQTARPTALPTKAPNSQTPRPTPMKAKSPIFGPCFMDYDTYTPDVLFSSGLCPVTSFNGFALSQVNITSTAMHGYFAFADKPNVPVRVFNLRDVEGHLIRFHHKGNNTQAIVKLQVCDPLLCSPWGNVTFRIPSVYRDAPKEYVWFGLGGMLAVLVVPSVVVLLCKKFRWQAPASRNNAPALKQQRSDFSPAYKEPWPHDMVDLRDM